MFRICISFILIAFVNISQAQLKKHTDLTNLPGDSEPVCTIDTYTGGFENSGFNKDSAVADFTLYDLSGKAITLSTELQKGKPILLISGSYTCPVYRNKISTINKVVADYGDQISVWIVYVVEAHPVTDPSPYSGKEWVTGQNQQENILYRQPTTYAERKTIAATHLNAMSITPTVLIDGPCNPWWNSFGPAPNNAHLINPNGLVFSNHGWFNKSHDDIFCDLDRLLGDTCTKQASGGAFTWQLDGSNTVYGSPVEILTVKGKLINRSAASASIEIMRLQNNVTNGWASAMCVDICLQEWVDATEFVLAAGDTQSYTMYFYSGPTGGERGHTRIGFRNKENSSNKMVQDFYGQTWPLSTNKPLNQVVRLYPNPTNGNITLELEKDGELKIIDVMGHELGHFNGKAGQNNLTLPKLIPGMYHLVWAQNSQLAGRILISCD